MTRMLWIQEPTTFFRILEVPIDGILLRCWPFQVPQFETYCALPHGQNPTRMNNKHLCSAQISLQDFAHPIFVGSHAVSRSTSGLNRTHQLRFWLQWSTLWSINSSCIMNFRLVCSSMKLTLLLLLKNWIDHQSPIVVASFFVCLAFTGSNSI